MAKFANYFDVIESVKGQGKSQSVCLFSLSPSPLPPSSHKPERRLDANQNILAAKKKWPLLLGVHLWIDLFALSMIPAFRHWLNSFMQVLLATRLNFTVRFVLSLTFLASVLFIVS
jgi:hypothetical protein